MLLIYPILYLLHVELDSFLVLKGLNWSNDQYKQKRPIQGFFRELFFGSKVSFQILKVHHHLYFSLRPY